MKLKFVRFLPGSVFAQYLFLCQLFLYMYKIQSFRQLLNKQMLFYNFFSQVEGKASTEWILTNPVARKTYFAP